MLQAFTSWAGGSKQSVHAASCGRKALQRLLSQQLLGGWTLWKVNVTMRARALALVRRVLDRGLWHAYTRWHETASRLLETFGALELVVRKLRHVDLSRGWLTFTSFAREHAAAIDAVRHAFRTMFCLRTSKALRHWASVVERAHQRQAIKDALLRIGGVKLCIGWRCWRLALMVHRRLFYAFDRWAGRSEGHSERSARRQQLREKAFQRLRSIELSKAWETWYTYVDAHLWAMDRALTVLKKLQNQGLARGWQSWCTYADQRARAIRLISRILHGQKGAAWRSWAEWWETRVERLEMLSHAVGRLRMQEVAVAWYTWRKGASAQRDARSVARRVLARLSKLSLAKGWTTYCTYVEAVVQRLRAMEAVLRRLRNQHSSRALLAWRANAKVLGGARATARGALNRWLQKHLYRGFLAWRSSCVLVRHHKLAFRRWMRHTSMRASELAAGLSIFEKSVRRLRMWHVAKGWSRFVEIVTLQMRLVRALKRLRNVELARCVGTWRDNALDNVEQASAYELAFRRLRHLELSKGFFSWATYAEAAAVQYQLLQDSLHQMRAVLFGGVVAKWHELAATRKTLRLMAKRFDASYRFKAFAWGAWLEVVEARHEARERMVGVLNSLAMVKVGAALRTWSANYEERQLALDALRTSAMRLFHHKMSRAFRGWVEILGARATLKMAARGFTHGKLLKAWHQWTEVSQMLRWVTSILNHLFFFGVSKALRQWNHYLEQGRNKLRRMRAAWDHAAVAALEHWHRHTISMKIARRVGQRMLSRTTARALRTWHEFAGLRDAARAIVSRVRYSVALRALRTWRDFADECDAAYVTLSRVFSHVIVRALRTWREFAAEREEYRVAMARMLGHVAFCALRTWKDFASERAEALRRVTRALGAFMGKITFKAYGAWRAAVLLAKEERAAERVRQAEMARALAQAALEKEREEALRAFEDAERERQRVLKEKMDEMAEARRKAHEEAVAATQAAMPSAEFGSASSRLVSFGEGTSDRVVILSARPRTVMARYGKDLGDADAAVDFAFARTGGSRPLRGITIPRPRGRAVSPPQHAWNSHGAELAQDEINRRRVWAQTAAVERHVAALRSGELPYDPDLARPMPFGSGRHSAAREEARFYSTSGRSVASEREAALQQQMDDYFTSDSRRASAPSRSTRRAFSFETAASRRRSALKASTTAYEHAFPVAEVEQPEQPVGFVREREMIPLRTCEHPMFTPSNSYTSPPADTVADYGHAIIFHVPRPADPKAATAIGATATSATTPAPPRPTPAAPASASTAPSTAPVSASLSTPRQPSRTIALPGGGHVDIHESVDGAIQLSVRSSPPSLEATSSRRAAFNL